MGEEKDYSLDLCAREDYVIPDVEGFLDSLVTDEKSRLELRKHFTICGRCKWVRDQIGLPFDQAGDILRDKKDPFRWSVRLVPPPSGIPLRNDSAAIQECRDHFGQIIPALQKWCEEQRILIDCVLHLTGRLIVNGSRKDAYKLSKYAESEEWFEYMQPSPFSGHDTITLSRPPLSSPSATRRA